MAGEIDIEFEDQNATLVEVMVDHTVTDVQVIVQDSLPPEVIEVHVDPSASQTAIDAAAAAQAILDNIYALIGGYSIPYGNYQIFKALVNANPANRLIVEAGDTIAGLWSGNDYVDDGTLGIDIPKGTWIRAKYNGGGLLNIPNYSGITF